MKSKINDYCSRNIHHAAFVNALVVMLVSWLTSAGFGDLTAGVVISIVVYAHWMYHLTKGGKAIL